MLYGVAANIAYAGYLLILRRVAGDTGHIAGQVFDATAGATVGALLFGLIFGGLQLSIAWHALGWLLLLSMLVQVAGWLLITASLPRLLAAISSMLLLLQPAGAMVLSAVVLSQRPTAIQVAGAVIACGGVVAAALAKQNHPAPAQPAADFVVTGSGMP
jgi:drug/metabolite transporter (DMT)-like permease